MRQKSCWLLFLQFDDVVFVELCGRTSAQVRCWTDLLNIIEWFGWKFCCHSLDWTWNIRMLLLMFLLSVDLIRELIASSVVGKRFGSLVYFKKIKLKIDLCPKIWHWFVTNGLFTYCLFTNCKRHRFCRQPESQTICKQIISKNAICKQTTCKQTVAMA